MTASAASREVVGNDVLPAEEFLMAGPHGGGGGGGGGLEFLAQTIAQETEQASSGAPLDASTAPIALEEGQFTAAHAGGGGGSVGDPPELDTGGRASICRIASF